MNTTNPSLVFDDAQIRRQRARAARCFSDHDFLFHEGATHLAERVQDVARPFRRIVHLGARDPYVRQQIHNPYVRQQIHIVPDALWIAAGEYVGVGSAPDIALREDMVPLADGSMDLVLSNLCLHWINDLPGALVQIRRVLQPDGLFLASLLGGETLFELRQCLMEAELAVTGGVSPRLSPTLDLPTASSLMQRAGFTLPVVDHERFTLIYPNMLALMKDVRGMGEGNAHQHRLRHATRRAVFDEAARLYQQRFSHPDGGVVASFDMLFLHGWGQSPARTLTKPEN